MNRLIIQKYDYINHFNKNNKITYFYINHNSIVILTNILSNIGKHDDNR